MKRLNAVLPLILAMAFILGGCSTTSPIHDNQPNSARHIEWTSSIQSGELRGILLWTRPAKPGRYPTVIVHPGLGMEARMLRPVMRSLADAGFVAVAADYFREIDGNYVATIFPWRAPYETETVINIIRAQPMVDWQRIGVLGFSIGGAHSLMLAARSADVSAAVVYYPMTNFIAWKTEKEKNWFWKLMLSFVRWQYNFEEDANNDETHSELLAQYSATNFSDRINIPTLIIHGSDDSVSPVRDSEVLFQSVSESSPEPVELLTYPGEEHAFNQKKSEATEQSWRATVEWLNRYLKNKQPLQTANYNSGQYE